MTELNIPPSQHVVDVSVIDSTAHIKVPTKYFIKDPVQGHEHFECPAYSFLIRHSSGKKVLFDLGLRPDVESFAPIIVKGISSLDMSAEKDVATILEEEDIAPGEIEAIIWSHWHCDHSGDPSTFPPEVDLVVGPGFKDKLLPGYPANPNALILESDYSGRNLCEIEFATGLKIGQFRAMDYFGDGSFYLLDSPGHAIGHLCALARTTPSTFIFMGGDGCHHTGSLRPNQYLPLPKELSPSPFSIPPHAEGTICQGALLEVIRPSHSSTEPYYARLADTTGRDVPEAEATIEKMIDFDASEDVFVIIAHDKGLLDVIDFFPKKANEWKEKGWKDASRWRFLEDFKGALPSA